MLTRFVCSSAVTAGVLTGCMAALAPAVGHAQFATPLPLGGGGVTVVGCIQRDKYDADHYILQNTVIATATNAPETTCAPKTDQSGIRLEKIDDVGVSDAMLGRWVEITGKLEKSNDDASMREIHVKGLRVLPEAPRAAVAPPPAVIYLPAPAPPAAAPSPEPARVEAPVATSGVIEMKELPKTASSLPIVGAIGLLSLAGGFIFSAVRRRNSR
jgi:LPXTG-motif cell wall-anchored protein